MCVPCQEDVRVPLDKSYPDVAAVCQAVCPHCRQGAGLELLVDLQMVCPHFKTTRRKGTV